MAFDPDLNPYIAQIQHHKDIIRTASIDDVPSFHDFTDLSRPVVVDLGCGAGNFLRDYALSTPDCSFVGFELRYKRLVKSAIKFKKHGITNVRLIQARAEDVALWFPPRSIKEVHINFPDPWPKKRHRKHRLISSEYLKTLAALLVANGRLAFKTDHEDYFHAVINLIEHESLYEIVERSEDLHNSIYNRENISTEFELLFKNKGYPVYYVKIKLR